jgi:hypothetical protein
MVILHESLGQAGIRVPRSVVALKHETTRVREYVWLNYDNAL